MVDGAAEGGGIGSGHHLLPHCQPNLRLRRICGRDLSVSLTFFVDGRRLGVQTLVSLLRFSCVFGVAFCRPEIGESVARDAKKPQETSSAPCSPPIRDRGVGELSRRSVREADSNPLAPTNFPHSLQVGRGERLSSAARRKRRDSGQILSPRPTSNRRKPLYLRGFCISVVVAPRPHPLRKFGRFATSRDSNDRFQWLRRAQQCIASPTSDDELSLTMRSGMRRSPVRWTSASRS